LIILAKNIVTVDSSRKVYRDAYLRTEGNIIKEIGERRNLIKQPGEDITDAS